MSADFWLLESPSSGGAGWDEGMIWRHSDYPDSFPQYPDAEFISYGERAKRLTELRLILTRTPIRDLLWTSVSDCVIQDRVLRIFQEEGFTGLEVRPAVARWKIRTPYRRGMEYDDLYDDMKRVGVRPEDAASIQIPKLWEVLVTGWGGTVPEEAGMQRIPGTNTWEGIPDFGKMVDPDQWDGSDFFIVWPFPNDRFVSDRVARCVRKNKITGVRLTRPEKFDVSYLGRGRAGGRLTDYMPEARAREIGEPLGIY